MTLSFNTNIGGSIGGGGTSNHAQLTNLDFASAGHTGFMSSESYIPGGTTLTVKTDSTGDFETLEAAISFLTGKFSDGIINIELGSGTFVEANDITISQNNFNIGGLVIKGQGKANTTLSFQKESYAAIKQIGCFVTYQDLTINRPNANTSSNDSISILVANGGNATIKSVKIIHTGVCVYAISASKVTIDTSIELENCKWGFCSAQAQIVSSWGPAVSINTADIGFRVEAAGFINFWSCTPTFTGVTTKVSQTVGTLTANGWITGITV